MTRNVNYRAELRTMLWNTRSAYDREEYIPIKRVQELTLKRGASACAVKEIRMLDGLSSNVARNYLYEDYEFTRVERLFVYISVRDDYYGWIDKRLEQRELQYGLTFETGFEEFSLKCDDSLFIYKITKEEVYDYEHYEKAEYLYEE